MDVKEFFVIINEMIEAGREPEDITQFVKEEELIALSNSYCVQCGDCCRGEALEGIDSAVTECSNMEIRDGLSYCLLHCEGDYPYGKKVPDLNAAATQKLDPNVWAKPRCCHSYGPYLVLTTMIVAEREGDSELLECVKCQGGLKMLQEYKEFIGGQ